MLIKLIPEQIAEMWEIIRYGIIHALPPTAIVSSDGVRGILEALLCGSMQCWADVDRVDDDQRTLAAIVTTQILDDGATGARCLLIYTLCSYRPVSTNDQWYIGINTLRHFAKNNGCRRLAAFTNVPYVIDAVKAVGFDTSYQFITLDI